MTKVELTTEELEMLLSPISSGKKSEKKERNEIMSKKERAKVAEKHTQEMEDYLRVRPVLYGVNERTPRMEFHCGNYEPVVTCNDTVTELLDTMGENVGKVCILSFASYKHPGGGYLAGSMAQEEAICAESNLFNHLREEEDFYEWNKDHANDGLYLNRAIYCKNVMFQREGFMDDDIIHADVLSVAAPNFKSAERHGVSMQENVVALYDRLWFIRRILEEQGVNYAILGAFGCGVFGQDAALVARAFKDVMKNAPFKCVYAVYEKKNPTNYQTFMDVFFDNMLDDDKEE